MNILNNDSINFDIKKINNAITALLILCTVVIAVFIYSTIAINNDANDIVNAKEIYVEYLNHAENLESATISLTDNARQYVVTGDKKYLNSYFSELNSNKRENSIKFFNDNASENYSNQFKYILEKSNELKLVDFRALELYLTAKGESTDTRPDELKANAHLIDDDMLLTDNEKIELAQDLLVGTTYSTEYNQILLLIDKASDELLEDANAVYERKIWGQKVYLILQAVTLAIVGAMVLALAILSIKKQKYLLQISESNKQLLEEAIENQKQLQIAKDKAVEAAKAKSSFLSNISHDLRTPINSIIGMNEIAKKHIDEKEKVENCYNKIDSASKHLLSLINDILDMSRIDAGKTSIMHDPMDMRKFVVNCVSIIQGQIVGRTLELVQDIENFEHPFVYSDELHLRQIVINLFSNAIKFTPDGGKLFFRVKELKTEGDNVIYEIQVEDTGIGMNKDFLSQIWEPFTQDEAGIKSKYKGSGLGTAIVKQFVELLDGTISVKSEVGEGTKFTIQIPFEINKYAKKEDRAVAHSRSIRGARILLVEDNELNREIAYEILTDYGVDVVTAENGYEAVEIFKQSKPGEFNCILMDIMMPIMDGLEATRLIRRQFRLDAKTVPIIALTANAFEEDIRKTIDAGMNAHISKPIDIPMMIKTIANFIIKE